jgi:hypothetical protein
LRWGPRERSAGSRGLDRRHRKHAIKLYYQKTMKQLFYDNKFYKDIDDKTASEIGMALIGIPKPYHIMVDSEALKASELEIQEPDAGTLRGSTRRYR